MRIAPLLAVLLVPALARADSAPLTAPVAAFDKVSLENVGGSIVARRGAVSIRVVADSELVAPPIVDAKARKLKLATETLCGTPNAVELTFDGILSKLENVEAYRKHRQKKYAESKVGFAKALALDPKNRIAAINLASAQQLLGDKDAAIATLDPWLKSAPAETYVAIAQDPELAPLLPSPALVALRAKTAGNVVVKPGRFDGAAWSADKALLAVERRECGWGMGGDENCLVQIELWDTKGSLAGVVPLQDFDESRASVTARAKAAQLALRDLGFKVEKVVAGQPAGDKYKFPGLKVGAVVSADTTQVNFLHQDTTLGSAPTLDHVHAIVWAPSAKLFVVSSGRAGREGCEGTDPTMTSAVAVTLP